MILTKSLMIRGVSEDTGLTKKQSAETVGILLDIIKKTLQSGEHVSIRNFGKFHLKERKERIWRNPATGILMKLPAGRIVKFKYFKRLKIDLNPQMAAKPVQESAEATLPFVARSMLTEEQLKKTLESHRRWLLSGKKRAQKAVFKNAKLSKADLYAADLVQVDFQGADLQGTDMSEADLYGANLQKANLEQAALVWANLDGAKLREASLERADLRWANLEGADLTGANLRWANFEGANLREAKLDSADLFGANLKNTDMEGAAVSGITLDAATESQLPSTITQEIRQTFQLTDWIPPSALHE
jgi:nucleoid DNA-binding protein